MSDNVDLSPHYYTLKRPDGTLSVGDTGPSRLNLETMYRTPSWAGYSIVPCRVVEGHGMIVRLDAVEEIRKEMAALTRKMFDGDHTESDVAAVHMAIDKAIGGAL